MRASIPASRPGNPVQDSSRSQAVAQVAVKDRQAAPDHPALRDLTPRDRALVLQLGANHPLLTIEQAVKDLQEAGM